MCFSLLWPALTLEGDTRSWFVCGSASFLMKGRTHSDLQFGGGEEISQEGDDVGDEEGRLVQVDVMTSFDLYFGEVFDGGLSLFPSTSKVLITNGSDKHQRLALHSDREGLHLLLRHADWGGDSMSDIVAELPTTFDLLGSSCDLLIRVNTNQKDQIIPEDCKSLFRFILLLIKKDNKPVIGQKMVRERDCWQRVC